LLYTAQDFSILPLVRKETLYNVDRDFVPIAKVSEFPLVIASNPKLPAANLKDALELARRQGTQLKYGTGGTGTLFHIVGEMLHQQSGVDLLHVPYRGGGPAQVGLLTGDTDLLITALNISKNIQVGQFRGLAVTASKRSRFLPDVPSAPESGLPNLIALSWFVVFGPAGLPKPIVERLSEELTAMASSPQFREKCVQFGTEPAPLDYTELPKYLAEYTASLKATVDNADIKIGE
jgi:tripartite-type tricarboxylate transporter receptor subunit TctC